MSYVPGLILPHIGDQRPRILTSPPRISSRGREAVEMAQICGLDLDPWEVLALDEMLGVREDGRWAAKDVGIIAGRQNGKDVILEARELFGLFLSEDEELIIHSAHLFDTSIRHFNRVLQLIESTPDLDRFLTSHKGSVSRSHGNEGIEIFRDGAKRELRFKTRTAGGGRGYTCDCLILNEAMILSGIAVGAILPALSAVPNPQVIYAGSAGMKHSVAFGRVRARGMGRLRPDGSRECTDPNLAFMEWSIDACGQFCLPDCEEHDQQPFRFDPRASETERIRKMNRLIISYAKANPGFGIRIGGVESPELSLEHIESERRQLDPDEFQRERLGVGDWPVEGETWKIIDEESWKACLDMTSSPLDPVSFGIDMTPDRKYACIVVAGLNPDGMVHVEITGGDELDHKSGDRWVAPRILELAERWKPCAIVIDKASQAGSLIGGLEAKGLTIESPTRRQYAQACGWLGSAVVPPRGGEHLLVHRDQVPLTTAVAGVDKRALDELWVWDTTAAAVDISPLRAATLAIWGFQEKANEAPASEPWVVVM